MKTKEEFKRERKREHQTITPEKHTPKSVGFVAKRARYLFIYYAHRERQIRIQSERTSKEKTEAWVYPLSALWDLVAPPPAAESFLRSC